MYKKLLVTALAATIGFSAGKEIQAAAMDMPGGGMVSIASALSNDC